MVVQKRNALLGRPLRLTPRLRREPLGCFILLQRVEGEEVFVEGANVAESGVEGWVGGCEVRGKRRREMRLSFGDGGGEMEKREVCGEEGEGSLCSAIISGAFSSTEALK
jgi:hypothetical protein